MKKRYIFAENKQVKKMNAKILLILLCISTIVKAQDFSIDGVNYTIIDVISNTVAVTEGSCFDGDLVLTNTVVNNNVSYTIIEIGSNAFGAFPIGCESLTSIVIPNTVLEIGVRAFQQCFNLEEITIGSGLESISVNAFLNVSGLKTFNIDVIDPINIGFRNAFAGIDVSLVELGVPEGSALSYSESAIWGDFSIFGNFVINGVNYVITGDEGNTLEVGSGSCFDGDLELGNVVNEGIEYTIVGVKNNAFHNCDDLTSVKIPNTVTFIGEDAFSRCSILENVEIGNGLVSFDEGAFSDVLALSSFSINIAIPISLNFIDIFENVDLSEVSLRVPSGSESAYSTALVWREFKEPEVLSSFNTDLIVDQFRVYIDPEGVLKIKGNIDFKYIYVFDLTGKIIKTLSEDDRSLEEIPSGIYILRLLSGDGFGDRKIVKN